MRSSLTSSTTDSGRSRMGRARMFSTARRMIGGTR